MLNESNILIKHISKKCEWKFDERNCNSNQKWNNNQFWWESKNVYISLVILLVTIALLIAVSIYCDLINCQAKEKHSHIMSQLAN